jgi:hypothetical protein
MSCRHIMKKRWASCRTERTTFVPEVSGPETVPVNNFFYFDGNREDFIDRFYGRIIFFY